MGCNQCRSSITEIDKLKKDVDFIREIQLNRCTQINIRVNKLERKIIEIEKNLGITSEENPKEKDISYYCTVKNNSICKYNNYME